MPEPPPILANAPQPEAVGGVPGLAHTPGPLEARCINGDAKPWAVINPFGRFGDEIVAGYLAEGDAILYAAAPDLLSALVRLEDLVDDMLCGQPRDEDPELFDGQVAGRAAIAKARGVAA